MKNININSKKLLAILAAGFILITSVSCAKENTKSNHNYQQEFSYTETNSSDIKIIEENKNTAIKNNISKIEDTSPSKENVTAKTENKVVENAATSYTNEDVEVINYFNDIEKNVEAELQKEKNDTTKDKLKGTFITIVDFLFYDSEINGIKFNDLTEGAKQNILETISSIDNKIMVKYPTYKEDISSTTSKAYNKASELIKKGANNVKNFSREKLGEENYNSIIDAKDELVYYTKNAFEIVGEVTGSIWETGKSKIKNWYENFKN